MPHTGEGEYPLALVGAHSDGQSWTMLLAKASGGSYTSGDQIRYETSVLCSDEPAPAPPPAPVRS